MKTHRFLLMLLLAVPLACGEPEMEPKVAPLNNPKFFSLGIEHISFSPKGKSLVAAVGFLPEEFGRPWGGDAEVKVWNTENWKPILSSKERFTDRVRAIFFVTEDSFVVTTNKMIRESRGNPFDGMLFRSWQIPEKKELPSLHVESTGAAGVDYCPSAKLIAASGALLSFPDLHKKTVLQGIIGGILPRFSPDGKRVLSSGGINEARPPGRTLRIHDTADGKVIAHYELPEEDVRYARFSPNGKMIVVATQSSPMREDFGKIHVFSADLSAKLFTVDLGFMSTFAMFTPDNEMLVNAEGKDYIEFRSIKSGEIVKTIKGIQEGATSCGFSPDGHLIAIGSGGQDRGGKTSPAKVRVFEFKTGKLVAELD